jgi:hypothetical protein
VAARTKLATAEIAADNGWNPIPSISTLYGICDQAAEWHTDHMLAKRPLGWIARGRRGRWLLALVAVLLVALDCANAGATVPPPSKLVLASAPATGAQHLPVAAAAAAVPLAEGTPSPSPSTSNSKTKKKSSSSTLILTVVLLGVGAIFYLSSRKRRMAAGGAPPTGGGLFGAGAGRPPPEPPEASSEVVADPQVITPRRPADRRAPRPKSRRR